MLCVAGSCLLASLPAGCFTTLQNDKMLAKVQICPTAAGLVCKMCWPMLSTTSKLHALGVAPRTNGSWEQGSETEVGVHLSGM